MPDLLDRLRGHKPKIKPLPQDSDLEQFFTDAEYACQAFENLVGADRMPKRLLVIHGVGGVGKSTLLKMYRLSCYRRGIPVALVGAEDAPSSVDVLSGWADDLSRIGVKLPTFANTLDHYRALGAKVEEEAKKDREAMRGAAEKAGKAAAKTAVEMAASAIPVIGPLAAALGGAGTEAAIDWLRGFLSKPDLDLYLDPSKRLTADFLEDLAGAGAKQRIVLMVDTYEQMTALDDWMRELTSGLPDNVLLVITGRALPAWDRAWPGWMGRAQIIELKEMTDEDLARLVHRYYAYTRGSEPDPSQVEAIVQFARGLPIAATTVVQLWIQYGVEDFKAVRSQVVADLVDRLLEGVPSALRLVFEAAAVLRYFNADSLRALLDKGDTESLYLELRRWPFIRPWLEGLAVHSTIRGIINEALQVRTPERFRTLHNRAITFYEKCIEQTIGDEGERYVLQRLYHLICTNEQSGIQLFQEMAEGLASQRLVNRLRALLKDVKSYSGLFDRETSQLWYEYYDARLMHLEADLPDVERMVEKVYRAISENKEAEPKLRAYALRSLGAILARAQRLAQPGEVSNAINSLEQSLTIVPLDAYLAGGLRRLAHVYRFQGEWDKAIEYYEKAIQFSQELGDKYEVVEAYLSKKGYHATRGEWKELLAVHKLGLEALSELPQHTHFRARFWGQLAWAWAFVGRYAEIEERVKEGLDTAHRLDDKRTVYWLMSLTGLYFTRHDRLDVYQS
jgi:tetratricopeptide (TPR) repeat protein